MKHESLFVCLLRRSNLYIWDGCSLFEESLHTSLTMVTFLIYNLCRTTLRLCCKQHTRCTTQRWSAQKHCPCIQWTTIGQQNTISLLRYSANRRTTNYLFTLSQYIACPLFTFTFPAFRRRNIIVRRHYIITFVVSIYNRNKSRCFTPITHSWCWGLRISV